MVLLRTKNRNLSRAVIQRPEEVYMNSKQKGNRFERQVAKILKEHYGYEARRGMQFRSGQEEADVIGLPGVHIECKAVENLNLEAALEQSERDAKPNEWAAVFHKKNYQPIHVTMRTRDFVGMVTGTEVHAGGKVTLQLEDFMLIYEETRP